MRVARFPAMRPAVLMLLCATSILKIKKRDVGIFAPKGMMVRSYVWKFRWGMLSGWEVRLKLLQGSTKGRDEAWAQHIVSKAKSFSAT